MSHDHSDALVEDSISDGFVPTKKGFWENALAPIKKYARFKGRATRAEYWCFKLVSFVGGIVLPFIIAVVNRDMIGISVIIYYSAIIGLFIPEVAVLVRRLHDINRSGFWVFVSFIPLVGIIILLVFACTKGTEGSNNFGPDPYGKRPKSQDL